MELVKVYEDGVEEKIQTIDVLIESATECLIKKGENDGLLRWQISASIQTDETLRELKDIKVKIYSLSIPKKVFIQL